MWFYKQEDEGKKFNKQSFGKFFYNANGNFFLDGKICEKLWALRWALWGGRNMRHWGLNDI